MCSYTTLVIYSYARYALALLIAVDTPLWSTRLGRPDGIRFSFLIAVDSGGARHYFALLIAVDIQLRQIRFCVADCGCFTALAINSCAMHAFVLLIAMNILLWQSRRCRPAVLSLWCPDCF